MARCSGAVVPASLLCVLALLVVVIVEPNTGLRQPGSSPDSGRCASTRARGARRWRAPGWRASGGVGHDLGRRSTREAIRHRGGDPGAGHDPALAAAHRRTRVLPGLVPDRAARLLRLRRRPRFDGDCRGDRRRLLRLHAASLVRGAQGDRAVVHRCLPGDQPARRLDRRAAAPQHAQRDRPNGRPAGDRAAAARGDR